MQLVTDVKDYTFKFNEDLIGSSVKLYDNNLTAKCSDNYKSGCAICDAPRFNNVPKKYFWHVNIQSDYYSVGIINNYHDLEDGNLGGSSGASLTSIALSRYFDEATKTVHTKLRGLGIDLDVEGVPIKGEILTVILQLGDDPTVIFMKNGTTICSQSLLTLFTYNGKEAYVYPAFGNPNTNTLNMTTQYNVNFGTNYNSIFTGIKVPYDSFSYNLNDENILIYPIYYVNKYIKTNSVTDGLTQSTAYSEIYEVLNMKKPAHFFGAKILLNPVDDASCYSMIENILDFQTNPIHKANLADFNWQLESTNEKYLAPIKIGRGAVEYPAITNNYAHLIFKRINFVEVKSINVGKGFGSFTMEDCEFISAGNASFIVRRTNVNIRNCFFKNLISLELNGLPETAKSIVSYCSFMTITNNVKGNSASNSGKNIIFSKCLFGKQSYVINYTEETNNNVMILPDGTAETVKSLDGYGCTYSLFEAKPVKGMSFNSTVICEYDSIKIESGN